MTNIPVCNEANRLYVIWMESTRNFQASPLNVEDTIMELGQTRLDYLRHRQTCPVCKERMKHLTELAANGEAPYAR